jgi:hypothetical protein
LREYWVACCVFFYRSFDFRTYFLKKPVHSVFMGRFSFFCRNRLTLVSLSIQNFLITGTTNTGTDCSSCGKCMLSYLSLDTWHMSSNFQCTILQYYNHCIFCIYFLTPNWTFMLYWKSHHWTSSWIWTVFGKEGRALILEV